MPVRVPPSLRLLLLPLLSLLSLHALAGAPRIEEVEDSLEHDRSFKVRVEAAIVLGHLGQSRSVPALLGALRDPHPAVRAAAAESLGRIGSPIARDGLVRAAQDPSPLVRKMARGALDTIGGDSQPGPSHPAAAELPAVQARRGRPVSFEVAEMGDRSHHAGAALRSHMRDYLIDQLRPHGVIAAGKHEGTFMVDGVIKDLATHTRTDQVEVVCAVQLVVSRQPGGGVFLMTSGEAMLQKSRRHWNPEARPALELEALENAVRGASEDLIHHLDNQRRDEAK
jgi:hypothetical protein